MKNLFFLCGLLLFCSACSKPGINPNLTKLIVLPWEHEIMVPEGYEHEVLQGIDTSVGRIYSDENPDFEMTYDIGLLAGLYVNPDDEDAVKEEALNVTFYYEIREVGNTTYPNCCTYFTFDIDDSPVNFVGLNNDQFDLMLDIMKSFKKS